MHQTSWLVCSYMHINYSLFFYPLQSQIKRATIYQHCLTPYNLFLVLFIHCRAKQAAKYMNSTVNAIQLIPCSFIHCRAKQAGSFSQWCKVAMYSVVALKIVFTKFEGCDLARRCSGNFSILLSVFFSPWTRHPSNQPNVIDKCIVIKKTNKKRKLSIF